VVATEVGMGAASEAGDQAVAMETAMAVVVMAVVMV
jgi:hypothetical protein